MGAPVIFLMGPTASGKTDLALALAERLPVEIISVDSAMVYRGMDIGTAKPSAAVRAHTPHHLIDICDPAQTYSAGQFRTDALGKIEEVFRRQRLPLLVGGTGLYFRALQDGLAALPAADPAVRAALTAEADHVGWPALHRRLAEVDPAAAARIHVNDPQRIQRALEVHQLTGRALSGYFGREQREPLPYPLLKLAVAPEDRAELRERVRKRFGGMLDRGLLEEIRKLYGRGDLRPTLPSMRLVGYRQGWQHLAGEISFAEMSRLAIDATRQLAKRQLTWLRGEEQTRWFDASAADVMDGVLKFLRQHAKFRGRM